MTGVAGVVRLVFMGWNMRSPTLTRWVGRRAGQIALIRTYKPTVFAGVEVGSIVHAKWISARLRVGSHKMKRVPKGGKWRYLWYDPTEVTAVVASGLYTIPTKWRKDAKQAAWAVLSMHNGEVHIYVAAHLENQGTEANRVQQMKDVVAYIDRLKLKYRVSWANIFVYVDTNSHGPVQRYLETTRLSNLVKGAHTTKGTEWKTQNNFKPRSGAGRKATKAAPSMDELLSGDETNAWHVSQPDCHKISDHDALIAKVL